MAALFLLATYLASAAAVHVQVHSPISTSRTHVAHAHHRNNQTHVYGHVSARSTDNRLQCNPEEREGCYVRPVNATRDYVIGHFEAMRKTNKAKPKWSGKRYFVLDLQECMLYYNDYSVIHNGMPWKFGPKEVTLKTMNGAQTMDLKKAHFEENKDYIEFKPKGETEDEKKKFNSGNTFYIKNRETREQGKHHYWDIGTSGQLYPSLNEMKQAFDCEDFYSEDNKDFLGRPERFRKHILELKKKQNHGGSKNLGKYPEFKKLMCLLDMPDDPDDVESVSELLVIKHYYDIWNMPLPKLLDERGRFKMSKVRQNYMSQVLTCRGLPYQFNPRYLAESDHLRSLDLYNKVARPRISHGFFYGNDTSLSGWLALFVKAMYRNAWTIKYDDMDGFMASCSVVTHISGTFQPQKAGLLFRGYRHDQNFLKSMMNKKGKLGEFSFEYFAGFTSDPKTWEKFFIKDPSPSSNYDKNVWYVLPPTHMARPLSMSAYQRESEWLILPHLPLTIEWVEPVLNKDLDQKIDALDAKVYKSEDRHAIKQSLDYIKKNYNADRLKNAYMVVLTVPEIDLLDLSFQMPLMDHEKHTFEMFYGKTEKRKYCPDVVQPERVVHMKNHHEDIMRKFSQVEEYQKCVNEEEEKDNANECKEKMIEEEKMMEEAMEMEKLAKGKGGKNKKDKKNKK
mmetsp:Transcript_25916/g.46033  ORF Transcript_25916/g.46033 Transcript_25916/m.46033 type:complete len:677 (+) Transcript_25916:20-2050(+)